MSAKLYKIGRWNLDEHRFYTTHEHIEDAKLGYWLGEVGKKHHTYTFVGRETFGGGTHTMLLFVEEVKT